MSGPAPLLALLLGILPMGAADTMAVIVNPASGVTKLSRDEAKAIFMGRQKYLASGLVALPVEQVTPGGERESFYRLLVNLSVPQVRAYWARLYFSGMAQPPRQTDSVAETLSVVVANKGAIGFVDPRQADPRVRVVLLLVETK
jgi:ABC-type phosphate transport system substrate-binding protein